jgi:hypothetical protein
LDFEDSILVEKKKYENTETLTQEAIALLKPD